MEQSILWTNLRLSKVKISLNTLSLGNIIVHYRWTVLRTISRRVSVRTLFFKISKHHALGYKALEQECRSQTKSSNKNPGLAEDLGVFKNVFYGALWIGWFLARAKNARTCRDCSYESYSGTLCYIIFMQELAKVLVRRKPWLKEMII